MKGLLIKDFLLLRSYFKTIGLLLVLFFFCSLPTGPAFFSGIVLIEAVMLAVSTFSYDDMAKWNTYMLSMPVSRKTAVQEKYVLSFLLSLIGIVLATAAGILAGVIQGNLDIRLILGTVGGCLVSAFLYVSVMIPLTYRFGAEKMRMMLILVFVVLFAVLFGGYTLLKKTAPGAFNTLAQLWPLYLLLAIAAVAASYLISVRIFEKKEI